ncbi:MAG: glycosyltransferase family 2 protein [Carboxydocellales bacterium]
MSSKFFDLSIIVPVYNEEENLYILNNKIKDSIKNLNKTYEIIYIDDGSKDKSLEILNGLAIQDKNIKIIEFRRNYGQTAAMSAGIDHAMGEIIIPMDGDLQNDPEDIVRLLAKINEGYDVVSGWRKNRKDKAISRRFPSMIANKIISIISGVHLHDYGCSLKAYKRDVIKDVRLYGEMHRFIPVYASWQGAKVTELVVNHHPRQFGQSKYGIERTFKVILDLIVIKFLSKYSVKPIYIFGGFGFVSIISSFLVGIFGLYLKFVNGISFIQTPLPLLSVMLFLVGFISILMGLLAEMMMRTYFESQNKTTYIIKNTINGGQA